jgi:hypothetical protein
VSRPWRQRTFTELSEDYIADAIGDLLKAGVPMPLIGETMKRYIAEVDWSHGPNSPPELPPPYKLFCGAEQQLRLPLRDVPN